MERPAFLSHRSEEKALEVLRASALTTLYSFVDEGILLTSELDYGYEDLPITADLAGHLRDAAAAWHRKRGVLTDFRVLQRAFESAFHSGLNLAHQTFFQEADGLRLDLSKATDLDSDIPPPVVPQLEFYAQSSRDHVRNVFTAVQDRQLVAVASTGDLALLDDFVAATCLWGCLGGVQAGLDRLEVA